jgi:hypothetical protein
MVRMRGVISELEHAEGPNPSVKSKYANKCKTYRDLEIANTVLFINSPKLHRQTHGDAVNQIPGSANVLGYLVTVMLLC